MDKIGVHVGEKNKEKMSAGSSQHQREDEDIEERRNTKQAAVSEEGPLLSEMIDKWSLYSDGEGLHHLSVRRDTLQSQARKVTSRRGRPRPGENREVVDLRNLLFICADAISRGDYTRASELLKLIKEHSSPFGDGNQRLAHCFVDGLEARISGSGSDLYRSLIPKEPSTTDILKAYNLFLATCPFGSIFDFVTNGTIINLARNSTRLHIIDFGIFYSFQWPGLIHHLSQRNGGPPKVRITGIDFPEPGFRPDKKAREIGSRLAAYAERFHVPFEYNAIAKNWQNIKVQDLKIDENEITIVNSSFKFENLNEETTTHISPRDIVLRLIRNIEPTIFLRRITNGTYSAPYFNTRFREAFFHYSALFDLFETIVPREDSDRLLIEAVICGKIIVNVLACEGIERVERPETYRQWHSRIARAGFMPLPFDRTMVKNSFDHVISCYHKDFYIDEDSEWLLQGWKGRTLTAMSAWKPC